MSAHCTVCYVEMAAEPQSPLYVKQLSPDARLPVRGSEGAAGYDLSASVNVTIPGRGRSLIDTGLQILVPFGTYGRIAPRSGLAVKIGLDVGAGVIDSDYRGEVKILLFNHSDTPVSIGKGDRIAQLLLERIVTPPVVAVDSLTETLRGAGGFGSTGTSELSPASFINASSPVLGIPARSPLPIPLSVSGSGTAPSAVSYG